MLGRSGSTLKLSFSLWFIMNESCSFSPWEATEFNYSPLFQRAPAARYCLWHKVSRWEHYCHSLIFLGQRRHFNQSFEHCLWETQIRTVLTLGQDSLVLQTDLKMEKTKAIYKAFYDCCSTALGHPFQKGLCMYVMLNGGATSAEGTKLYKCSHYRSRLTWDIQPIGKAPCLQMTSKCQCF